MITREQRETIGRLIESQATALATLQQADFASEFKAHAAFDYVRASDELEAYLNRLVEPKGKTAADADGWIEWGGGECPVETETQVDVRYRDGEVVKFLPAGVFDPRPRDAAPSFWRHDGFKHDIVAYRIVK